MHSLPIVFTDLDGTLLDHEDYSYEPARPALKRLRERGIPLVLCTSKTAAEILALRADPDLHDCAAIVENGGGILRPGEQAPSPEPSHARLLRLIDRVPAELRDAFSGFSSWSEATLVEHTGLDPRQARLAARRDYTEPGQWLGDENSRHRFIFELERLGIVAQQGGRFMTLGFAASKAGRMRELIAAYRNSRAGPVASIALGDAPNDIEMLKSADLGIVIPNPAHAGIAPLAGVTGAPIMRAKTAGPQGWNDSLLGVLDDPDFPPRGT